MNEQLQQALADLIEKSMAVAGDALAFAQEELPDVIQQLLMWKAAESVILTAVWFFGVYLLIFGVRKAEAMLEAEHPSYSCQELSEECAIGMLFACIVLLVVLGITLTEHGIVPDFVQILVAPKAYLLEYAANLAK